MALDPHEILQGSSSFEDIVRPPLAGTRRQRMQRLQIGLIGLGAMVLMVGLAGIIIASAQQNQAAMPEDLPPLSSEDVPPLRDPLADAGVVPELPTDAGADPAAQAQAGTTNAPARPAID
jgi:hypothetical protein